METLAAAYMADLILKSRRWDEHFDPKPPSLLRRMFHRCVPVLAARKRVESSKQCQQTKCTAQPLGRAVHC